MFSLRPAYDHPLALAQLLLSANLASTAISDLYFLLLYTFLLHPNLFCSFKHRCMHVYTELNIFFSNPTSIKASFVISFSLKFSIHNFNIVFSPNSYTLIYCVNMLHLLILNFKTWPKQRTLFQFSLFLLLFSLLTVLSPVQHQFRCFITIYTSKEMCLYIFKCKHSAYPMLTHHRTPSFIYNP